MMGRGGMCVCCICIVSSRSVTYHYTFVFACDASVCIIIG